MTREELEAIETRAEAATAGPWTHTDEGVAGPRGGVAWNSPYALTHWLNAEGHEYEAAPSADLAFIAAARTDVPALLAEVRRLREVVNKIDGYVRACEGSASTGDKFWTLRRMLREALT